jgi:cobalt-zinc-cadmium efflux system outer membrane protein
MRRSIFHVRSVHRFGHVACVFLGCIGAALGGNAQSSASLPSIASKPMSLQEVVSVARVKNPNLLAARQSLLSVKAQETQAGLRQNPSLAFAGSDITLPAAGASNPYSYIVQVSRLFERGEKRRWRVDSAISATDQTREQYTLQEQQTILSVKQSFTNMLLAKAALKLAQGNLRDFRHELDINKARYDAGDIGKLDYERLDLQLAQFETDETTADLTLKQSSYQLQTLMGIEHVSDSFDIAGELMPPPVAESLAELEQRATAARPDYIAAKAAIRLADANVKLAFAQGMTDPTIEGEYDRSGADNSAGFNISIPLRIFDRNQGNKETAKYLAQASRFSEIAVRAQVFSDVDQAWVGYLSARTMSDRYNGHYLDEAKDVLSIAQFAYEHGGLGLIDYLNALQDDRTTTLNALNAYAQTWMAVHQLSFATTTELTP